MVLQPHAIAGGFGSNLELGNYKNYLILVIPFFVKENVLIRFDGLNSLFLGMLYVTIAGRLGDEIRKEINKNS